MYKNNVKRIFDFVFALIILITFSWLYGLLAIFVLVKLGNPVIFRQVRVGKDEKLFMLYKFRSMSDARDDRGELLPDLERVTKFGKFLRSSSLDELPEVWNIMKGDMSFIGPRPLVKRYLPYYSEEEHHRHDVRPGLSGLAQVNGRNAIIWEKRFAYDLQYIRHITFLNDIKIVFVTLRVAIKRSNVIIRRADCSMDFDNYRQRQWERQYESLL